MDENLGMTSCKEQVVILADALMIIKNCECMGELLIVPDSVESKMSS